MISRIISYLKYLVFSKHKYGFGIHSPFLFNLITNVFNKKNENSNFTNINELRKELRKNNIAIKINDFGAGSKIHKSNKRVVKQIAKHSSIRKKYGKLLFNICNHFKPKNILELGTSLGISSSYMSIACPDSNIYTIEGCTETYKLAQENFIKLNIRNVYSKNNTFEIELPKILQEIQTMDLVFFDGNHTKNATLNYFETCIPFANNNSIFIFDDIHWSKEMTEAWEVIKSNSDITLSIDLYQFGLVFFNKSLHKQNYIIRY